MQAEMKRSDFHIFPETETEVDIELLAKLGVSACDNISKDYGRNISAINVIILPEIDHTSLNIKHLNHHYSTDVLTFELSSNPDSIEGEIYLNDDVISANSTEFGETFFDELLRIVIHGILHLVGLNDHSEQEKAEMRNKEDFYMNLAKVSCETS